MMTFKRGGKALPIGGLFLTLLGVVLTVVRLRAGDFGFTDFAGSVICLSAGPLMMILFSTVQIDPENKVVKLASGLRFRPRLTVHYWDEFDTIVALEPSGPNTGNSCYSLYFRNKRTQDLSILVQQYNDLDEMHKVARELTQLMGLPAIRSRKDKESEL